MKKTLYLLLIFIIGCQQSHDKASNSIVLKQLEQLVDTQNYFKLKQVFESKKDKLSNDRALYFEAIVHNVFNNLEQSNNVIDELLKRKTSNLTDSMLNKLYNIKLLNHINLYEYSEAASASDYIQNNFYQLNDSSEIESLENEIKIWKALKDVPKQEIIKTDDATIPMTRDKVGLFNINVAFGDSVKNLLFDTGANFSVIIRSLAEELGYKIIEANFYVTAATGKKVKSDIAIADELSIGGIIFKNVLFLVIDDADLSFPQIDYYINGAIGFPVIEAMDEIRINRENQIFVPKNPVEYDYNNFALNGLMPIIAVEYNGDTLRLNFDTGAASTSLYPQFYKDYKKEIESNYEKEIFTSGSGGGMIDFEGYIINDINFKVAESETKLNSLRLHIEDIGGEESNFHGNFGQDYIKQFDEMIMSFKYSSIVFK